MKKDDYEVLIAREAEHWGRAGERCGDPQIWEDEWLFEIFFGREYRLFLDRASSCGTRVLELGCGRGGTALQLASRGLNVTGIDLSPERTAEATREAARRGLERATCFLAGDLNLMPLPEPAYDCIVAHDALHHILELGSLLDRVRRALKPSGKLVVMDYGGMGRARKLIAAGMFALLPTYRSYRSKWGLRSRLGSFLSSEKRRREALESGSPAGLHPGSPFEEISGPGIVREIEQRFRVEEYFTFCPFWFYLAPKLRLSGNSRYRVGAFFHGLDTATTRILPRSGAHFLLTACND